MRYIYNFLSCRRQDHGTARLDRQCCGGTLSAIYLWPYRHHQSSRLDRHTTMNSDEYSLASLSSAIDSLITSRKILSNTLQHDISRDEGPTASTTTSLESDSRRQPHLKQQLEDWLVNLRIVAGLKVNRMCVSSPEQAQNTSSSSNIVCTRGRHIWNWPQSRPAGGSRHRSHTLDAAIQQFEFARKLR